MLKNKAKQEADNYVVIFKSNHNNLFIFEVENRLNTNKYIVYFSVQHVTCTCPWFKQIELMRHQSSNQVCKHVALVTLYCNDTLTQNDLGQRFFSKKDTFIKVAELLDSFDPQKNICLNKKHVDFSQLPLPVLSPNIKFKYYTKKQYAQDHLDTIPVPVWIAERYNRDSKKGGKPSCKM